MRKLSQTIDTTQASKTARVVVAGALIASTIAGFAAFTSKDAQAAQPAEATYSAQTTGSIAHFGALQIEGIFDLADINFGLSSATLDSETEPAASASAQNFSGSFGGVINVDNFLLSTESSAAPTAPANEESIATINAAPIFETGLINVRSEANWESKDVCAPVDTALSSASADIGSLSFAEIPLVGNIFGFEDATRTESTISLVSTGGENDERAVQAVSSTTGVTFNITNFLSIEVGGNPTLTATASGKPGGASVDYQPATVSIAVLGGSPITLPVDGTPVSFGVPANPLLQFEASLGQVNQTVAEDGTSATGDVALFSLTGGLGPITFIDTQVFPLTAEAHLSEGGLQCEEPEEETDGGDNNNGGNNGGSDNNGGDNGGIGDPASAEEKLAETGDNATFVSAVAAILIASGIVLASTYAVKNGKFGFGRR